MKIRRFEQTYGFTGWPEVGVKVGRVWLGLGGVTFGGAGFYYTALGRNIGLSIGRRPGGHYAPFEASVNWRWRKPRQLDPIPFDVEIVKPLEDEEIEE